MLRNLLCICRGHIQNKRRKRQSVPSKFCFRGKCKIYNKHCEYGIQRLAHSAQRCIGMDISATSPTSSLYTPTSPPPPHYVIAIYRFSPDWFIAICLSFLSLWFPEFPRPVSWQSFLTIFSLFHPLLQHICLMKQMGAHLRHMR